jgi:prevent-host-death family protein
MPQSNTTQLVKVSMSEARDDFADTVDRARIGGDRVVLHRHGKGIAAMISMQDLSLLEFLERRLTRQDIKEARAALAEARANDEEPVSWEALKADLGLGRASGGAGRLFARGRAAGKKAGSGKTRAAAQYRSRRGSGR